MSNKQKIYITYEYDWEDINDEFISENLDTVIDKALSYKTDGYDVIIRVFELDGGIVYWENFSTNKKPDKEIIKRKIINREDKIWKC